MKIFEFYFNPQAQQDRYFKAFSFEWERKQENSLGTISVIGELQHALPQNSRLLDKIASLIKDEYTSSGDFKFALKKTNEFLSQEMKRGNVDWLGNLHLGVLVFKRKKDTDSQTFSGAKTGNMQLFLTRKGALGDFRSHLENTQSREGPAKIFGNIVSGKLFPDDKIVICTNELFEALSNKNIFQDLAYFKEEDQFQGLFKSKEKELSKIPGLLSAVLIEEVRMKKAVRPALRLPRVTFPRFKLPRLAFPQFKLPKISLPKFSKPNSVRIPKLNFGNFSLQTKRRIVFILLFLGLLLLGSLLF
ncbi:MAG: hypothetical protein HYW97_01915 [Candidatus Wildermuthbacteria bacterium]|nr:hypothetical protein [Candidatus Wildermuthbacteria bacterium]